MVNINYHFEIKPNMKSIIKLNKENEHTQFIVIKHFIQYLVCEHIN